MLIVYIDIFEFQLEMIKLSVIHSHDIYICDREQMIICTGMHINHSTLFSGACTNYNQHDLCIIYIEQR